jgi:hypothetical protein
MTDSSWGGIFDMRPRAPQVHGVVGRIETSRGGVVVVDTDNPVPETARVLPTYVAIANWRPDGNRVLMFVSAFFSSEELITVNVVWAAPELRGETDDGQPSVPVQIGRWLFDNGHLTHHSIDRTRAGDRWAHLVGGVVPELAPEDDPNRGSPEDTERSSLRIYQTLCEMDWSTWLADVTPLTEG